MIDRTDPGDNAHEDDETTQTVTSAAPAAEDPHDADVVRLFVRDAEATALSCAAGSAVVTDRTISVPSADVEAWLRTGVVTRES